MCACDYVISAKGPPSVGYERFTQLGDTKIAKFYCGICGQRGSNIRFWGTIFSEKLAFLKWTCIFEPNASEPIQSDSYLDVHPSYQVGTVMTTANYNPHIYICIKIYTDIPQSYMGYVTHTISGMQLQVISFLINPLLPVEPWYFHVFYLWKLSFSWLKSQCLISIWWLNHVKSTIFSG